VKIGVWRLSGDGLKKKKKSVPRCSVKRAGRSEN
jgi:hypothetical protein